MPPRKLKTSKPKTPTPLDLTRQLLDVSVTERGSFRTCRRRWLLEVIENLVPKQQQQMYFLFGTGIHHALEAYYSNMGSLIAARTAFAEWFIAEGAKLEVGEEWEELNELRVLGEDMIDNYPVFDATSKASIGKPLAIEGTWVDSNTSLDLDARPEGYPPEADVQLHDASRRLLVPIVDPISKQPIVSRVIDGKHPLLTARIDILSERKTPKAGLWIIDHKTTSSSPSDRGLDFDDQITGYCYVVWRWTGVIPRGVMFNYLIKQTPKEPRLIGKNKDQLSTAKDQLTTADQYRAALKDHGLVWPDGTITSDKHAECLDALLARGWDPFYRRFEVMRNEHELLAFESRLAAEYSDMQEVMMDEDKQYPNPSAFLCPMCSVKTICQAIEDGSDVEDVMENQYKQGDDRKAAP